MRFLLPAILLFTLTLAGCSGTTETKTQNPAELEKGSPQAIQNSERELQPTPPPPGSTGVPAN